ncbi:MAG: bifunctional diaminohydroxyphosphoribosylaminopyrimidine deaminase/5-amino-6-(5-phosphoribosylamino)uracil reductase RibD [Thermodesulfobacteriota bacterium]
MDERYMKMAIGLARRGVGKTNPNPAVGAVIVKDGTVVGKGYHRRAGLPHAEIEALRDAGNRAKGGVLYVTLEPCDHTGRTPPCTESIIAAGVKNVVVGAGDPNPLVTGRGVRRLRRAGIAVTTDMLESECSGINEAYNKYITLRRPYVTLKLATTLDGRIATKTGESQWITGERPRRLVHRMRSITDAVMVGSGTVLRDDPSLTTRYGKGRDPVRVVVDSTMRIPLKAKVFGPGGKLIVATTRRAGKRKIEEAKERGATVLILPSTKEGVHLGRLMARLGEMGIMSIMIEGGGELAASSVRSGIVDKLCLFFAPKVIGGDGVPVIEGFGVRRLVESLTVRDMRIRRLEGDFMVEGYL